MKSLNQRGFALLEVIFVTAIISTLALVAVPKFNQTLDKLTLDYEMKRFCNTVEFISSMNRTASYNPEVFSNKIASGKDIVNLEIADDGKSYQPGNKLYKNILPTGFSIEPTDKIVFSPSGRHNYSGTITITSRLGDTAEIIFDSVGRWRGSRNGK